MGKIRLTFACGDYDLVQPLVEGTVRPDGIELTCVTLPSPQRHWRMLRYEEFDVCDLSMASYLVEKATQDRFRAIPVFPHRRFRHSYVFINAEAGISRPQDLAGKRIGVRRLQNTASVWMRGILQDDYGLDLAAIRWYTQDEEDLTGIRPTIPAQRVPRGRNLDEMLVAGDLEAVIYPEVLPSYAAGVPKVRRLFEDYKSEEQRYFRRTGIFPIMHTVVIKREVLERYPWVALNLYEAFEQAKALCYRRLLNPRRISLAWAMHLLEEQKAVLGEDPFAYGLEPNRHNLQTLVRYCREQGLIPADVALEELFVPSTVDRIPRYLG